MERELHYSIGEAADLLGVSVPTLRLYEREGLILPLRKTSRHRRYTEIDLDRIRCIRETIRDKKVSIAGIRSLLSMLPCWKIKSCPEDIRVACPAFQSTGAPCWVIENKPWKCGREDCRICPVYTEASDCQKVKYLIAEHTINP